MARPVLDGDRVQGSRRAWHCAMPKEPVYNVKTYLSSSTSASAHVLSLASGYVYSRPTKLLLYLRGSASFQHAAYAFPDGRLIRLLVSESADQKVGVRQCPDV
jgi:hypothetical protein